MCYFVNYQTYKNIKRIIFFLELIIPAAALLFLTAYSFLPQTFRKEKAVLFSIKPKETLIQIVQGLSSRGAIRNPYLFYIVGFISGYSRYIEAGTYFVSLNESPAELYHKFASGDVATASVTIPPGLNIFQIARVLSKNRVTGGRQFLSECFNRKFLLSIGASGQSAEGFLYPDTYTFKIYSKPDEVIKKMVGEFMFKIKTLNIKNPIIGYKYLIIASMIIKEANGNIPGNMKMISSVIYNRIKRGMPLDIDSTSIYAHYLIKYRAGGGADPYNNSTSPHQGSKVKAVKKMKAYYLRLKGPYNTYLNYGLPPTPISNPDLRAIKAAMNPSDSSYLYYISTSTGQIIFSRTLESQNYNIAKFLK